MIFVQETLCWNMCARQCWQSTLQDCCLPLSGALRPDTLVAGVVVLLEVVTASEDEAEASWVLSTATCCSELCNNSLIFCCKVFWVSSCFLASNNWACKGGGRWQRDRGVLKLLTLRGQLGWFNSGITHIYSTYIHSASKGMPLCYFLLQSGLHWSQLCLQMFYFVVQSLASVCLCTLHSQLDRDERGDKLKGCRRWEQLYNPCRWNKHSSVHGRIDFWSGLFQLLLILICYNMPGLPAQDISIFDCGKFRTLDIVWLIQFIWMVK